MTVNTAWTILVIAGLLEVCWAIGLKYAEGFTKLIPSLFTIITLSVSMYLLAKAAEVLPIGTAYGVWVGIGALGTALLGIILFNESVSIMRAIFLSLLLIGIIGLKISS